MENPKPCEICGNPSQLRCSACQKVFYCDKSHQKKHWKRHKNHCVPFKISKNDELGYHLVAIRPIKENEVLMDEFPMLKGPREGSGLRCVSCLNSISSNAAFKCSKCTWLLCSDECSRNPEHEPECYFRSKNAGQANSDAHIVDPIVLDAAFVLRCLYQKQFFPVVWEKLLKLYCGGEKIRSSIRYSSAKDKLIKVIYNYFGLRNEFTEEEIMTVWTIITVNQFSLSTTKPVSTIFEVNSLLEHNCKPNCYFVFYPNFRSRVIAGMPIAEGEHLSVSYIQHLWTTPKRQSMIQEGRFTTCKCERCVDVTEFGTNFSAFKCQQSKCKDGIVLPKSFITEATNWTCNLCKFKISSKTVNKKFFNLSLQFLAQELAVDAFEELIDNYSKILAPNHYLIFYSKTRLIALITNEVNSDMKAITNARLKQRKKLCLELFALLKILVPADKITWCSYLFSTYQTLRELCRRAESNPKNDADFTSLLKRLRTILNRIFRLVLIYHKKGYQFHQNEIFLPR